jgi:YihY family inner membrane protein
MSGGMLGLKRVGRAFLGAARAMMTWETPRDAGSISYFSLVALFPAILIMIAVADTFLGWLDLHDLVVKTIAALFPGSRRFLEANLREITDPPPPLLLSCAFAVLWLSTWIFSSMENALNRAWNVHTRRTFWESRLRSITLMLLGGMLLLTSAGITWIVSVLRLEATDRVPAFAQDQIIGWLWSGILLTSGFLIAIVVFFCVYKLMPDRKVLWQQAISGAIIAAVLWEIASSIFVRLLPVFDSSKVYGRTGAFIALLVWVYTTSLIMLFGANFSAQLHQPSEAELRSKSGPDSGTEHGKPRDVRVRSFRINR